MNYAALLKAINTATAQLQGRAALAVNQALVLRNWRVGAWILEFEQHGKDRAKYGEKLCESLATDLKRKGLTGLDMRTLRDCRGFARHYPQIRGTVSPEFKFPLRLPIRGTLSPEFMDGPPSGKRTSLPPIRQTLSPATSSPCHRRKNSAPSSKPTANASKASCLDPRPANAPRASRSSDTFILDVNKTDILDQRPEYLEECTNFPLS
jgi:hypothetical protein